MGWIFTNKGSQTTKEYFEHAFNYDKPAEGRSGKIIRFSATWTTAYMAYEVKVPATDTLPAKTDVIAIVCLIRHVPNAVDGYTFGYKDMDESMGPNESRCPKTILELLTPTDSQYAKDWRARCWEHINKRKNAPKVKAGDWVKFAKPITFSNGDTLDTFNYDKGSRFKRYYGVYRITNWREKEYANLGKSIDTQGNPI